MIHRLHLLSTILRNVREATANEYGLIAALVAAAVIVAMKTFGSAVTGTFNNASTHLKKAAC